MSYKIVRQTVNGQRKQTVSNGFLNYEDACIRAGELKAQMLDDNDCEMRGDSPMEVFIVEED